MRGEGVYRGPGQLLGYLLHPLEGNLVRLSLTVEAALDQISGEKRIFVELLTSDRKLKASREGS